MAGRQPLPRHVERFTRTNGVTARLPHDRHTARFATRSRSKLTLSLVATETADLAGLRQRHGVGARGISQSRGHIVRGAPDDLRYIALRSDGGRPAEGGEYGASVRRIGFRDRILDRRLHILGEARRPPSGPPVRYPPDDVEVSPLRPAERSGRPARCCNQKPGGAMTRCFDISPAWITARAVVAGKSTRRSGPRRVADKASPYSSSPAWSAGNWPSFRRSRRTG